MKYSSRESDPNYARRVQESCCHADFPARECAHNAITLAATPGRTTALIRTHHRYWYSLEATVYGGVVQIWLRKNSFILGPQYRESRPEIEPD